MPLGGSDDHASVLVWYIRDSDSKLVLVRDSRSTKFGISQRSSGSDSIKAYIRFGRATTFLTTATGS